MSRLSAIIITFNEAQNIADCLASVAFCDERIVVDCGSHDDTVRLAEQAGARVVNHAFNGFGEQKNFALSLAQNDWVLSLDADERITPALQAEIIAAIKANASDAYEIPRRSIFFGRPIKFSGMYPDHVRRLFRRSAARFSDRIVHENLVYDGKYGRLREPIVHHARASLEEMLSRIDKYSTANAAIRVAEGRKVSFGKAVFRGWFAFVRTYILQLGFLDGKEGFIVAVGKAESTYYGYLKAWLTQREAEKYQTKNSGRWARYVDDHL